MARKFDATNCSPLRRFVARQFYEMALQLLATIRASSISCHFVAIASAFHVTNFSPLRGSSIYRHFVAHQFHATWWLINLSPLRDSSIYRQPNVSSISRRHFTASTIIIAARQFHATNLSPLRGSSIFHHCMALQIIST